MTKTIDMTNEEVMALDNVARIYSRKFNGYYGLEFDDIYGELWIFLMEKVGKMIDNPGYEGSIIDNIKIISNYAKMKAIDLVRYSSRRSNQISTDPASMDVSGGSSVTGVSESKQIFKEADAEIGSATAAFWKSTNVIDDHTVLSLMDLFNDGTREDKYIKMLLLEQGIVTSIDGQTYSDVFGEYGEVDDKELGTAKTSMTKDTIISKSMGFANSSSSAYKVVKHNVYVAVCEELGFDNLKF